MECLGKLKDFKPFVVFLQLLLPYQFLIQYHENYLLAYHYVSIGLHSCACKFSLCFGYYQAIFLFIAFYINYRTNFNINPGSTTF